MTLPAWPAIGYRPKKGSWKKTPYLAPISSEMEGGNLRTRRRPGDNVAVVEQTIEMQAADYATFETFLSSTIFGGVSRFTMSVWMGSSYVSKTVQFTEPPSEIFVSPTLASVSMKLRVYDV